MHLTAGLQCMVASQLTRNTMGYLTGTYNLAGLLGSRKSPSSVTTTIATNTEHYNFMAQLQLGVLQSQGDHTIPYHSSDAMLNELVKLRYFVR